LFLKYVTFQVITLNIGMIPQTKWKKPSMLNGYLLGKTTLWEGLPYGKENQMLFIDDEPNKTF
jgi:hypothetical protein